MPNPPLSRPILMAATRRPAPQLARLALHLACAALLPTLPVGAAFAQPVQASQEAQTHSIDIPPGRLSAVLGAYAAQAGVHLSADGALTQGLQSEGLKGRYGVAEGFARLLQGNGLEAVSRGDGGYTLRKLPAPVSGEATLTPVTVTATGVADERPNDLPPSYAGGQVARGGRLGMLGNKDVMDTPFSMTSYTNQTIEDQQARTLVDVLANEPSIITGGKGGATNDFSAYRGFMNQALTASNSLNGLPGMAPMQFPSTDYIERVEVLRGPSALLKGASTARMGALGGTVDLVTKKAGDEPLTQLTTRYISDSQFGAHLDLGRRLGADKTLGIRFNGSLDDGDTPVDTQRAQFRTAALNLDYRGERIRLSADVAHQSSEVHAPNSVLRIGSVAGLAAVPKAPDNSTPLSPSWGKVQHKGTLGMVQGEVDLSERVTAYAAIGAQRYEAQGNADALDLVDSAGAISLRAKAYRDRYDVRSMQGGLRATATTGLVAHVLNLQLSRLQWTLGTTPTSCRACAGVGTRVPVGSIYDPVFPAAPMVVDPGEFEDTSRVTASSIAIADTMSLLDDRIQFTAGVRRQRVKSAGLGQRTLTATVDTSAWSPSFALVVKPWERVSLYGSYIENLEPGSAVGNGYTNTGEVFPPYKSKQYETGVKVDWGRVMTTLAVFQIAQPSTMAVPGTAGGLPTMTLDGEQRNRGVELNAYGELTRGVRLLSAVTYLDAIRTKTANGTFDGARAAGVPRLRAVIGGEWDTPFAEGLTLTGRLTYTSDVVVSNARPDLTVPSWTQVDLGARYLWQSPLAAKPVAIRFGVDNVFDKSYWKVLHTVGNLWRSNPRTYRLSATVDF
ncbi:TonB-dependent receptor [Pseudothauera rhizosphaerae]|nr:TonB-dependent receptor [Pseudothauera rhizosphaerae]